MSRQPLARIRCFFAWTKESSQQAGKQINESWCPVLPSFPPAREEPAPYFFRVPVKPQFQATYQPEVT